MSLKQTNKNKCDKTILTCMSLNYISEAGSLREFSVCFSWAVNLLTGNHFPEWIFITVLMQNLDL